MSTTRPTCSVQKILVAVMGLYLAVNITLGNFIEPRLLGRSLGLSPLVVFLSLLFWGWLWGVWGMVLAVPIAATARIIFEQTPVLQRIGALMSDN